jgi:hypothetical protein
VALKASSALAELQRTARSARRSPRPRSAASGFVSGLTTMYFLDPTAGKGRRHLAREKAVKLLRRGARETAREASDREGAAEGEMHEIRGDSAQPEAPLDDATLVDRVESVIFRDPDSPKGGVTVNAQNGVIYLRGEVQSPERAEQLAFATRSVDGVVAVKNLLHLPGEHARTAEDARNTP